MPYVDTVDTKVTDDGVTAEQKTTLVRDVTDSLVHVVLDLVDRGYSGVLTTEYRRRSPASK